MLLSHGTIFIMGVFSINPVNSGSILRHYVISKNCTHIGVRVELLLGVEEALFAFLTINGVTDSIGAAALNGTNPIVLNYQIKVKTWVIPSKSPAIPNVDSFHVDMFVQFAENTDTYMFQIRVDFNPTILTDVYRKARCSPLDQTSVCEYPCLCDTPIYKRGDNQNIIGKCCDPATLTDSPGILIFDGECPQAPETTVPETTTPAPETTTPASERTTPASERTTPASKRTTPAPKRTTPALEPLSFASIGIVIGVIVGVVIMGLSVYFFFKRNGKKRLNSREVSDNISQ